MKKYLLLIFAISFVGCKDNKPEEYNAYSKLMHTIQLTENDMCANVILTVVCHKHICDKHINTIKVNCLGSNE